MKLHVFPASPNAKKVLMVNELLGLNVPVQLVDITQGAHKSPAFLALNPNGRIPVLEFDDGRTLWESNAIANCLASQVDTDLWPKSNDRYDIMRWQFWESCHWTPACSPFISRHLFKDESIDLDKAQVQFHAFAGVLDSHLNSREWLSTENMTTADISVGSILHYRDKCLYPMSGYEHISQWMQRIENLPAWQAIDSQ